MSAWVLKASLDPILPLQWLWNPRAHSESRRSLATPSAGAVKAAPVPSKLRLRAFNEQVLTGGGTIAPVSAGYIDDDFPYKCAPACSP
mgnify:CR=1 FL=1